MRKTFQFKLYASKRNRHLHRRIDISSEIYNHCIALHKRYYRLFGKSLHPNHLKNHLVKLKKRFPHWNIVGSQAVQDIAERIDFGYKKFFRKENFAPPTFRKKRNYKSFTLKQAGWKLLEGNQIKIGNFTFKYVKSRDIHGTVKTITVKRDALGDIYLFFSCELPDIKPETDMQGKSSVGFDFGLTTYLTPNVGEAIEAPLFFKQGLNKIRKASKNLSSKKKGSNHRKQARLNLARTHKKIANQRHNHHFQLAKKLSEQYTHIFLEDLSMKGMVKLWGRKISDLGFAEFVSILKYQCSKTGTVVHKIDRFFPSSKMCNECRFIKADLSLRDRLWTCPCCNTFHDRDKNASINIHREGAASLGLDLVRPSFQKAKVA